MPSAAPVTLKAIRARLTGLRRRTRFLDWREVRGLAKELRDILSSIQSSVPEPMTGIQLVTAFYETDSAVLECCDDSNGVIGEIYRNDAVELYSYFASRCPDKDWLAGQLLELLADNDYGVRDFILDRAASFLDESDMREMVARLWQGFECISRAAPEADQLQDNPAPLSLIEFTDIIEHEDFGENKRPFGSAFKRQSEILSLIGSLAWQLNDPALLEAAYRADRGSPSVGQRVALAELCLKAGSPATALAWLESIDAAAVFMADRRRNALLGAYQSIGQEDLAQELALQIFRASRSAQGLNELLAVSGAGSREEVLQAELATILEAPGVSYQDIAFMSELGLQAELEGYLLARRELLDGKQYYILRDAAKGLAASGHPLGASLCYRALIDSCLALAKSKYYPYALRDLRQLVILAPQVRNWRDLPEHELYLQELRLRHGRKYAFWDMLDPT